MKINLVISIILLIISLNLYAQDIRVNNSFVITINDKIVVGSIARVRLIVSKTDIKGETIEIGYIPGELYFNRIEDKDKLYSDTTNHIVLAFDNYQYKKGKQFIRSYKIRLNKDWFKYSFIVLRIYDLNKKKASLPDGTDYYYAMDFPGYSILPTKKKL